MATNNKTHGNSSFNGNATVDNCSSNELCSIMALARYLARRGTIPDWRQANTGGPSLGCANKHNSSAGQPFPADQTLSKINGTVGKTGSGIPIKPSTKLHIARMRQNASFINVKSPPFKWGQSYLRLFKP
ncbi:hypothetical protein GCM10027181_31800 [Rheinheimera gaetbuli]